MSTEDVRKPPQLFTSLVSSSILGDMVGGGFFRSHSPRLVKSAGGEALRSWCSSLQPKTLVRSFVVSSRPSLRATPSGQKARSTHTSSGSFLSEGAVALDSQSSNISKDLMESVLAA